MSDNNDDIHKLLSRGLDADLNRAEMRMLYRAIAHDDTLREEAGRLAALETGLAAIGSAAALSEPREGAARAVRQALLDQAATGAQTQSALLRFWVWLRHPQGISIQPLSFASGLAVAVMALFLLNPVLPPAGPIEPARLTVHDMPFETARARVDWTYQFIVLPGGATRVMMELDDDLPMRLRLEAAQPVAVSVDHHTPGKGGGEPQSFTVEGIGFASLRAPRAGDVVTVHNNGAVPVIVYAYTNGYGGSWVVPGDEKSL
ncbi:MAG: hypothetical protein OQK53_05455 [Rhodospirillales bacterium]|nr:hypothetical protein [Rhodospirillales bacterium]